MPMHNGLLYERTRRRADNAYGVAKTILGRKVKSLWEVPDSEDRIVLLMRGNESHDENLLRITGESRIVWRAPRPQTGDAWVECRYDHPNLYANSWSGYLVRIDPETGASLSKTFTK